MRHPYGVNSIKIVIKAVNIKLELTDSDRLSSDC
jgi:hypothetical protein